MLVTLAAVQYVAEDAVLHNGAADVFSKHAESAAQCGNMASLQWLGGKDMWGGGG